jgi:putative copper resistance protein D
VEAEHALLQRALTIVLNLSFALLVGASAASLWLRARRSAWAHAQAPRLRAALLLGAGVALPAHGAMLWIDAASMAEVPLADAWPAVRSVIAATHYGLAWTIGAAALLVVAGVSAARVRAQAGMPAAALRLAALAVLLYSRSMVSHAGAGGDFTWAVAIDWLHLVLVSLWVGEVAVAGLLVLRRAPDQEPAERADCAAYVEALSRSATLALAGIFATGLLGAWRVLETPQDLVGNPYGVALSVKVGLVLCAAALGGYNRFVVMPSLLRSLHRPEPGRTRSSHRFAGVLQLEALVLLAVVVAAAVLTSTPPPMASP